MKALILKAYPILILSLAIIVLKIFIIDFYKVQSVSMSPTLISGDYVLVSKITLGPRIINFFKLLIPGKVEYIWLKGLTKVKKNDILVFNYPQYEYLADSVKYIYGIPLIKRCVGIPGSTVRIIKNGSQNPISNNNNIHIFPHDTTLHWSVDNFGPLCVPSRGDLLELRPENVRHYRNVLLYENSIIQILNDSVFLNSVFISKYCLKYNYYFMLGDNFYQSKDSRYWGFLPETHIIGKATRILFSIDHNAKYFKKVRWNRILRKIESNTPEYILTDK